MDIKKILESIFLFRSLSKDEISDIAQFSKVKDLKKGEMLFEEGEDAGHFFIVISGKVKVYKLSFKGAEQILHVHKPFDLVAEASIFEGGKYPASSQALSEVKVIRISGKDFIDLIVSNPQISLKLLKSYSQRLRGFVSMVKDLSLSDVKGRIASYLLRNSRDEGGRLLCRLKGNKKELASMLGTVPETLSRNIKFLKDDKIIRETKGSYEILDTERLKEILS